MHRPPRQQTRGQSRADRRGAAADAAPSVFPDRSGQGFGERRLLMIKGYAATEPKGTLKPFEYDPGPLGETQVEIKVEYCGLCHSDLSMLDNEWGTSQYPLIAGHEIIGTVAAMGPYAKGLTVGQRAGLGWLADSCLTCEWCKSGNH